MNNYWEDQDMSEELKKAHDKMVNDMEIPSWAIIDCPFCEKKLSPRSVRNISLCLNARNIGDIAVEFCCDACKIMDTMYFREGIQHIDEFVDLIAVDVDQSLEPSNEPLIEEKMYKLQYNNLVEKMVSLQGE